MLLKYSFTQRVIPEMLPNRCQSLNIFVCNPHKHWLFQSHFITQTRKIKFSSIQFCIGYLIPSVSIWFQLSCFHGLSLLVLSICYHIFVIRIYSIIKFHLDLKALILINLYIITQYNFRKIVHNR